MSDRDNWLRFTLLAAWALLAAGTVAFGERASTINDFDRAFQAGRIQSVTVDGALPPGVSGYGQVALRWREGVVQHMTTVVQFSSEQELLNQSQSGTTPVPDTPVTPTLREDQIIGDVSASLIAGHPGLHVINHPGAATYPYSTTNTIMGWTVHGALANAFTAAAFLTFVQLLGGVEPWRASRWAWFWIIVNPAWALGCVAFLLLSGPLPFVRAPRRGGWRLRGGWAFILTRIFTG